MSLTKMNRGDISNIDLRRCGKLLEYLYLQNPSLTAAIMVRWISCVIRQQHGTHILVCANNILIVALSSLKFCLWPIDNHPRNFWAGWVKWCQCPCKHLAFVFAWLSRFCHHQTLTSVTVVTIRIVIRKLATRHTRSGLLLTLAWTAKCSTRKDRFKLWYRSCSPCLDSKMHGIRSSVYWWYGLLLVCLFMHMHKSNRQVKYCSRFWRIWSLTNLNGVCYCGCEFFGRIGSISGKHCANGKIEMWLKNDRSYSRSQ